MAAVLRKWIQQLTAYNPLGTPTDIPSSADKRSPSGIGQGSFIQAFFMRGFFMKAVKAKAFIRAVGTPRRPAPRRSTVYIGETTATLGSVVQGKQTARQKNAKKRLGNRGPYPHLTQSLTLSHISKKLGALKSSEKIHLILDDDFFQFIDIEAPHQIPARELETMFVWALNERGFGPLDDWYWEIYQHPSASDQHYHVALLQRQQVELYLERLALHPAQVASLQPARVVRLVPGTPPYAEATQRLHGPWLDEAQLNLVMAHLQQPCSPVNLLANIATRQRRQFTWASLECVTAALLLTAVAYAWWPQHPPNYLIPSQLSLATQSSTHPLLHHEPLWQALQTLDHAEVGLQELEFQRGRWHIKLYARNLITGQTWLEAFTQALDESWRVTPLSIRSSERGNGHTTIVELEVSR